MSVGNKLTIARKVAERFALPVEGLENALAEPAAVMLERYAYRAPSSGEEPETNFPRHDKFAVRIMTRIMSAHRSGIRNSQSSVVRPIRHLVRSRSFGAVPGGVRADLRRPSKTHRRQSPPNPGGTGGGYHRFTGLAWQVEQGNRPPAEVRRSHRGGFRSRRLANQQPCGHAPARVLLTVNHRRKS